MKTETFAADQELIRALERHSRPISCRENQVLFDQSGPPRGVFILRSGEVALVMKAASGRVVMCLTLGSGALLGLPGVIANEPYSLTAMVRKGSVVSFVTRQDFEALIQAEPSLYPKVLQVLAGEVRMARQALREI